MEFLEKLMQVIVDEGIQTPKAQVERYLSPILGLFLEEILKKTFHKEYQMIVPEFPIRKGTIAKSVGSEQSESNQSTNIDYLMYNQTENKFVFIELKTDSKSFKPSQRKIYEDLKCVAKDKNNIFGQLLYDDLEKILSKSTSKDKYKYLKTKWNDSMSAINDMEIIYIVPAKTGLKEEVGREDENKLCVLYFNDLPVELSLFSEEWKIILEYLKKLDMN
ncbi:hypothetical protein FA592_03065 [Sulfurospirillum diekertiae]|uniref:Uncharacterized protein n=1 Tax=Sulfurospirillum diekertiae TaxID=1854492 RepID=A0A6G9VQN9_9BACT|nr:hypothetical protein [Sulfurospirillum diekertiae]QIR75261.1 hypothetical protein FA584_03165 [Sulfurospirillum diekertiae]QIR77913.1 hypothetical protein FA592_03065 [Sulfurospirillum diekertiae]